MRPSTGWIIGAAATVAVVLSACGSDPATRTDVSTSAGADVAAVVESITGYADDWSIALTGDQVDCISGNLDSELLGSGESLGEVDNALLLLACDVDVSVADGGTGRSPLEAIVGALLVDEGAELTDAVVTCATDALVAGFGVDGFVDLLTSVGEPSSDDDAVAQAAFDSCGLDGAAIVDG